MSDATAINRTIPADAYRKRLLECCDDLSLAFQSIYGSVCDTRPHLAALFTIIDQAARARPPWLAAIDDARAGDPGWLLRSDRIGYCCYVDRFGPRLSDIEERIAYLRELGVSYLHLLPFWHARRDRNDGGFAIVDHERVAPSLGTNATLIRLARRLAAAGISLCSDLVLDHTADTHAWARAARAGDLNYQARYHIFPDRHMPDRYEATVPEIFPETAPGNFSAVRGLGYVWTSFHPYQWDLNWNNPAVCVAFVRILLKLANLGVGAFRLDGVKFLWKQLGTSCCHLPQTRQIVRLLHLVTRIVAPSVVLKEEAAVASDDALELPYPRTAIAYGTDMMAAAWIALARNHAGPLQQALGGHPAAQNRCRLNYVRSHDEIAWGVRNPAGSHGMLSPLTKDAAAFLAGNAGFARGQAYRSNGLIATVGTTASLAGLEAAATPAQRQAAVDRIILLHALIYATPGMPVIYMGDEIGQLNAPLPDDERDERWLHRPLFDNAAAGLRHQPGSTPHMIFTALVKLAKIRRDHACFDANVPLRVLPTTGTALLAFLRGEKMLALYNFSAVPLTPVLPDLPAGYWRDLALGEHANPAHHLEAWSFRWLIQTS